MTTLDHYDFCKPYISDNEYIFGKVHQKKALPLPAGILS